LSRLTVQQFASFEALAGLRKEWNDLAQKEGLGPSQSFEWLSTLWDLHSANRKLIILVVREQNEVTGLVPLVQEEERRKGIRVHLLKMLSSFHATHGTPMVLGRGKQETLSAILDYINQQQKSWALWFTSYTVGDDQEQMFSSSLRQRGYSFSTTPGVRSPYLRPTGPWNQKLESLQPRLRTALRSREKRLREKGAAELRFLDGPAEWESGLAAIREIEEDSWKKEAGTAITSQDFQWQFYSCYAPIAANLGTLRIPVLYVNGEPIAYDYAVLENGVYYLLKTSYKNKWHESYPGFVLRKLLMEWAYTQQVYEIDFLGKDEDWKMKWTSTVREHRNYYIFGRNLAANYLQSIHFLGTLLKGDE